VDFANESLVRTGIHAAVRTRGCPHVFSLFSALHPPETFREFARFCCFGPGYWGTRTKSDLLRMIRLLADVAELPRRRPAQRLQLVHSARTMNRFGAEPM